MMQGRKKFVEVQMAEVVEEGVMDWPLLPLQLQQFSARFSGTSIVQDVQVFSAQTLYRVDALESVAVVVDSDATGSAHAGDCC